jgi:hypothetical protein
MLTKNSKFVFYIDNFLEPNQLIDIQKMINKVTFKECYLGDDKNKGLFAYRYLFSEDAEYELPHKEVILSKIESLGFVSRKTHVFDEISIDTRHNTERPLVHVDPTALNFLLYLHGDDTLSNGTGFWHPDKKNETKTLSAHVGFVENRAVLFTGSTIPHSDLQSFEGSSRRFCLTIFVHEK